MRLVSLFLISLSITSTAFSAAECIGPVNAAKSVVYLHGMDTTTPSNQEVGNRAVLEALAKNLNIRFALPRATNKCPTSPQQLCWAWGAKTSADLAPVKAAIKSAASDCFPNKEYSVLGFSNGGVAVTALLRLCEPADYKTAIVVGAVGSWSANDPKNLSACGPVLTSLLGSEDQANQKAARDLIAHLSLLKASVSLIEYKGGHKLYYEPLANLLK